MARARSRRQGKERNQPASPRTLVMDQDITTSLSVARSDPGHFAARAKLSHAAHSKLPGRNYWRIQPKGKKQSLDLLLPLPEDFSGAADDLGRATRAIVTPAVQKHYLLATGLALRQGLDGRFELREKDVVDLLGLSLYGRDRPRPSQNGMQAIRNDLAALSSFYVNRAGDTKALAPEPLLNRYDRRGQRWWKHAEVVWTAITGWTAQRRGKFVQVPWEVLRLDSRDVPLALGLARFWRLNVTRTIIGDGEQRLSLRALAKELGEDVARQARARGSARYFSDLSDRIVRVAELAALGEVRVLGDGPAAEVVLTPAESLALAYAGLMEGHERWRAIEREAAVLRAARQADVASA